MGVLSGKAMPKKAPGLLNEIRIPDSAFYSTVTLLARFRGWSTFEPRFTAT